MKKRIASVFLAVLLIFAVVPVSASANAAIRILAIGDSITTGYGLADASAEGFTALLQAEGYGVVNKAVDGNTALGIAEQLSTGDIAETDVKAADVITVTCGGNDLLALLYQKVMDAWNTDHPDDPITPESFMEEMQKEGSAKLVPLMSYALRLLDKKDALYMIDDPDFSAALASYIEALNNVIAKVRQINPDVQVVVATQYNPYAAFRGALYLGMINLDPIYSGMEAGVLLLNQAITENAEVCGYTVADVKTVCDAYVGDAPLYNASVAKFNMDFHPAAEGHRLIAETFDAVIKALIPTYSITVADTENGVISVKQKTAKEGDTVTIAVTDSEYFAIDAIEVLTEDGTHVAVTAQNTFIMPAGNVVVSAQFRFVHNHNFVDYASDNNATCTQNGTYTAKCQYCDATDTMLRENSKTAHAFENGICTACGAKESATAGLSLLWTVLALILVVGGAVLLGIALGKRKKEK